MDKYKEYKAWWIKHGSLQNTDGVREEMFEQHVNDMSLYELMETLSNWDFNP